MAETPARRGSAWGASVGLICACALALRVGYVFALEHHQKIWGDAYVYHYGAQLLVQGRGFIDPFAYRVLGQVHQTAQHPPLYTVVLALPTALGLSTFLDHQLWSCLLGTGTVAVTALVGRRLAGPRAGLVAAGLAAFYPNMWISDAMVAAETLALLMTAAVLLAAYRLWERPAAGRAAALGAATALAALTRAEQSALFPLIFLPWALLCRQPSPARRAALVGVGGLAAAMTLAPWVGYNLSRFHRPVLLTTGLQLAMVQANCDQTYYGADVGYFSLACIPHVPGPRSDESDADALFGKVATTYIARHEARVPFVVFARLGRTWGFYHPVRQVETDAYLQGWNLQVADAGLAAYALLVPAAAAGLLLLRRRRVPISPLLAPLVAVSLAVVVAFGQTRYRLSCEVVIALLASVAVDAALQRLRAGPPASRRPEDRREAAPAVGGR